MMDRTDIEFALNYAVDFGLSVNDSLKLPASILATIKPREITESDKFEYRCKHDAEPVWEDIEGLIREEEILARTEKAIEELADSFTNR